VSNEYSLLCRVEVRLGVLKHYSSSQAMLRSGPAAARQSHVNIIGVCLLLHKAAFKTTRVNIQAFLPLFHVEQQRNRLSFSGDGHVLASSFQITVETSETGIILACDGTCRLHETRQTGRIRRELLDRAEATEVSKR
jgi:hypothetical protein